MIADAFAIVGIWIGLFEILWVLGISRLLIGVAVGLNSTLVQDQQYIEFTLH